MDRRKINLEKLKNTRSLNDYLDEKYGKVGSIEREQFQKEAWDFYASQILLFSREEAKITQKELSERTGLDKSYISRIENGIIQPTVGTFLKLLNGLGAKIEITKPTI